MSAKAAAFPASSSPRAAATGWKRWPASAPTRSGSTGPSTSARRAAALATALRCRATSTPAPCTARPTPSAPRPTASSTPTATTPATCSTSATAFRSSPTPTRSACWSRRCTAAAAPCVHQAETDFPRREIENFEQSGYENRLFSTCGYAPPYPVSLTLRSLLVKTFLISLFAVFLSFSFATHDAEARRMGGSKSFGMQRTAPAKQSATPTAQPTQSTAAAAKPATTPTAAPAPKRSWMGPLAGLAAGLGLAALFSHFGMGGETASFLMLALLAMAAFMLFRFFMRRNAPAPAMQYAGAPAAFDATPSAAVSGGHAAGAFPPGFDADAFAREAKLNFIRLQAAFDAGNLDDLRAFTSPEVFAEVRMQLAERGDTAQTTDVVSINAEVLEAVDEGNQHVVSVRFTGLVREAADQAAVPLDEIWHLTKPVSGQGGWVISGIQQQ